MDVYQSYFGLVVIEAISEAYKLEIVGRISLLLAILICLWTFSLN